MYKYNITLKYESRYEFKPGLCMECPFVVEDMEDHSFYCLLVSDSDKCPLKIEEIKDDN